MNFLSKCLLIVTITWTNVGWNNRCNELLPRIFFFLSPPSFFVPFVRQQGESYRQHLANKIRKKWPWLSGAAVLYLVNYISNGLYTIEEFEEDSKEFDTYKVNEPVLYIDLFPEESPLIVASYYDYQYRHKYGQIPGSYITATNNIVTAFERAKAIAEARGYPFHRIVITDHGKVGTLDSLHRKQLNELLDRDSRYRNTVAPGAKTRITGCAVGRDEQFLKDFGRVFMPNGGDIYASRVDMGVSGYPLLASSSTLKTVTSTFLPAGVTAITIVEEWGREDSIKSRLNPMVKVKIPPR